MIREQTESIQNSRAQLQTQIDRIDKLLLQIVSVKELQAQSSPIEIPAGSGAIDIPVGTGAIDIPAVPYQPISTTMVSTPREAAPSTSQRFHTPRKTNYPCDAKLLSVTQ